MPVAGWVPRSQGITIDAIEDMQGISSDNSVFGSFVTQASFAFGSKQGDYAQDNPKVVWLLEKGQAHQTCCTRNEEQIGPHRGPQGPPEGQAENTCILMPDHGLPSLRKARLVKGDGST
jgi:hypothetical protein